MQDKIGQFFDKGAPSDRKIKNLLLLGIRKTLIKRL
jgi:hypothetical protein